MTGWVLCLGVGVMLCQVPPAPPPPAPVVVCPHISEWSKDDQRRVAAELRTLPADSATGRALGRYINLRDQVRACRAAKAR